MFLDYIWMSFVAQDYYAEALEHVIQNRKSQWIYNWPTFLLTYLLLAAGLSFFVLNKPSLSLFRYFLNGAFFGLIIYGSFHLVNYAAVENWPIMLIDVVWGTVNCGIASLSVPLLQKLSHQ